jgi:hypothetical protein
MTQTCGDSPLVQLCRRAAKSVDLTARVRGPDIPPQDISDGGFHRLDINRFERSKRHKQLPHCDSVIYTRVAVFVVSTDDW